MHQAKDNEVSRSLHCTSSQMREQLVKNKHKHVKKCTCKYYKMNYIHSVARVALHLR